MPYFICNNDFVLGERVEPFGSINHHMSTKQIGFEVSPDFLENSITAYGTILLYATHDNLFVIGNKLCIRYDTHSTLVLCAV